MGGVVGGLVGGLFGDGDDAADASRDAANTQAQAQREALEYLKEREAIPQQFREGALTQLGGLYGLEGGEGSQQALIDAARNSPLYGAIMGTLDSSEEAIMRQASATGGLRSGNVQNALAKNAQQLENQALLESYSQQLSGLQGLAGLPSNASQIASQTAGIGQTLAQGQIGAAQAQQAGQQNTFNNLLGLGSLAVAAFSDIRLKRDIKHAGKRNGHNWYRWTWSDEAKALGLSGEAEGVMAHEVVENHPEAITTQGDYLMVNYDKLGVH